MNTITTISACGRRRTSKLGEVYIYWIFLNYMFIVSKKKTLLFQFLFPLKLIFPNSVFIALNNVPSREELDTAEIISPILLQRVLGESATMTRAKQ